MAVYLHYIIMPPQDLLLYCNATTNPSLGFKPDPILGQVDTIIINLHDPKAPHQTKRLVIDLISTTSLL